MLKIELHRDAICIYCDGLGEYESIAGHIRLCIACGGYGKVSTSPASPKASARIRKSPMRPGAR